MVERGMRAVGNQPVSPGQNESPTENEARWRAQVMGQLRDIDERLDAIELRLQALEAAP